ncbi:hypothetical protein KCP73_13170 [Salmonella enterica subsp. enterica]|nr:hypothetical protein KCP73_13170 [Salmonella enterica subsp. enterica]
MRYGPAERCASDKGAAADGGRYVALACGRGRGAHGERSAAAATLAHSSRLAKVKSR